MMTDLAVVANYANDYSIYLILHPICACVGLLLYGMYTGIGNTASIRNMMFVAVIFFYICQKILNHLGQPANEVIIRSPRAPPEADYFDQAVGDF